MVIQKKLKILYVSHARKDEGGAEISLKTFATQFKKNGHTVVYAALEKYLEFPTYIFKKFKPIYTFEGYERYLSNFLREIIQKERPDVIHANDRFSIIPAVIAAKKEGVPIVVNFRDFCLMITTAGIPYSKKTGFLESFGVRDVFRTSSPKRWLWELYRYWYITRKYNVINAADSKICNSHAVKMWADKQGINDSIVIHNAIELALPKKLLSRAAIRKEWNLPQDAPVILFLSEFNIGKGVDMLFKIINKMEQIHGNPYFLILGKGQEKESIISISQKNKNVLYLGGRLPHTEVYKAYRAADLVILPSKNEPFSRIIVESLSMGTPVISSNRGGGKEVIKPGKTGLLVDPENVDEWINAINTLITNKKALQGFGPESRIVAKSYSRVNSFADLSRVYHAIIDAHVQK